MVGEFVVPGGNGAVLFEPVEEPFDLVAFAVGDPVKAGLWRFVAATGNHGLNAPLPQRTADGPAAVALVPGQAVGPQPRSTPPDPRDRPTIE